MSTQSLMQVRMSGEGVVGRRTFLRTLAAGAAVGAVGFKEAMAAAAPQLRKEGMSCVLVFLNGAPSQFETWDPKPGHANGGPTKAIDTAGAGIQVAGHWPGPGGGEEGLLHPAVDDQPRGRAPAGDVPDAHRLPAGRRHQAPDAGLAG